ncbi:hypothetical protein Thu_173 [Bacillus phage Thurquoise]|nr:hypothetical protein Thu_173 [Bacillus phage Thurquoise]
MGWKQKLNTQGILIDARVDAYLKGEGFYESTMNPRFLNDWSFVSSIQNHGAPCWRLDTGDPNDSDYTLRIFVSETELYMEVQTSYGSLDRSYHVATPEGVTMETVDDLLDELID